MEYIWVGNVREENDFKDKMKDTFCDLAGNHFQLNYIKAIEKNTNKNVHIINAINYKNGRKINKEVWYRNNVKNIDVGYLNIFGIKQIFKAVNILNEIKNKINEIDGDICIFSSALSTPFMYFSKYIKKHYKNRNIKLIQVVPDLPQYMNFDKSDSLKNKVKELDYKYMKKFIKYFDGFLLITEQMKDCLNIKKDYLVVESLSEFDEINSISFNKKDKVFVYAGGINDTFGIYELIEAFKDINDKNIKLEIYGNCNNLEKLNKAIANSKNVSYKGIVTVNELINIERNCFCLINPRRNNGEYTKYSFPSKTIDYLYSGRPVLMHKLDGIPKEYDDHLLYINETGNPIKDLKESIINVSKMDNNKLNSIGKENNKFVVNSKNYLYQGKRAIEFVNKLK